MWRKSRLPRDARDLGSHAVSGMLSGAFAVGPRTARTGREKVIKVILTGSRGRRPVGRHTPCGPVAGLTVSGRR